MLGILLLLHAKKIYINLPDGDEGKKLEYKAMTAEAIGTNLLKFSLFALIVIAFGYFAQYGAYYGATDALALCGGECSEYAKLNYAQIIGGAEAKLVVLHVLLFSVLVI